MDQELVEFDISLDPQNPKIILNGVDILQQGHLLSAVTIEAGAGEVTRVTLEYPCQLIDIDGVARIEHFCPIGSEEEE